MELKEEVKGDKDDEDALWKEDFLRRMGEEALWKEGDSTMGSTSVSWLPAGLGLVLGLVLVLVLRLVLVFVLGLGFGLGAPFLLVLKCAMKSG